MILVRVHGYVMNKEKLFLFISDLIINVLSNKE